MKKLTVCLCMVLLLLVLLSACGRRTAEAPSGTCGYEVTVASVPTTQPTSAFASPPDESDTSQAATTVTAPPLTEPTQSPETTNPTGAAESSDYEIRPLNVQRDGLSLYGNLYIPETQNEKLPAVILSHSANMTSDSMKSYCERIVKMGFIACSFDFCGGSTESRSDGKPADMTIFTEVEDLKAVLQMIKGLDFVDNQKIFLFGTSQGGLVSALTAAEYPDDIRGLLLFYPAFNIPDSVQKFAKLMPKNSLSAYNASLLDYDVYEHIKSYKGDVLIVHGTMDFVVPYSYSEKAAEVYENCELHLIAGATHGFNADNYVSFGDFDEKTWPYAQDFLEKHREA